MKGGGDGMKLQVVFFFNNTIGLFDCGLMLM
jgi:hypothetical protein